MSASEPTPEPALHLVAPETPDTDQIDAADAADVISELARLLIAEETLESTLARIARMTVEVIPACDQGTLSVIEDGKVLVRASTGEVAQTIDDRQFSTGVGPCLDAMRERRPIMVDCAPTETRWPDFMKLATENGVVSTLSIPLEVGDRAVGILNLYALSQSFGANDDLIGRSFAREAAVAVANARAMAESRELVSNLEKALETRDLIGTAVGVLMVRESCDAATAFRTLRKRSQSENVKLRKVAERIVSSFEDGG